MRREERLTVQGPIKEQRPDGMSHRGFWEGRGGGGGGGAFAQGAGLVGHLRTVGYAAQV